jgi:hypothetical protein
MTWLSGVELLGGAGALALAVFLVGFFRFVPLAGSADAAPSQMRLTFIPLVILLIVVCGFALIFRGVGLI